MAVKKKTSVCPKCGSKALWYKGNVDIQCTCCMNIIERKCDDGKKH